MRVQVYLVVGGHVSSVATTTTETLTEGASAWTTHHSSLAHPVVFASCAALNNVPYLFGKVSSLSLVS